jgi:hypothetical protein
MKKTFAVALFVFQFDSERNEPLSTESEGRFDSVIMNFSFVDPYSDRGIGVLSGVFASDDMSQFSLSEEWEEKIRDKINNWFEPPAVELFKDLESGLKSEGITGGDLAERYIEIIKQSTDRIQSLTPTPRNPGNSLDSENFLKLDFTV